MSLVKEFKQAGNITCGGAFLEGDGATFIFECNENESVLPPSEFMKKVNSKINLKDPYNLNGLIKDYEIKEFTNIVSKL